MEGSLSSEFSVTYGVTGYSPLNEIDNFHVVKHFPQDVMHIILEGSMKYEVLLMLKEYITAKKYFTVDILNERIACFSYSSQDKRDKPSPINPNAITAEGSLRQSGKYDLGIIIIMLSSLLKAAQMWILVTNLPLMIGDLVPFGDEVWECFLLHIDILQLCTAKKVTAAQAGFLEALIHDHHQMYTRCYAGARLPPKAH